MYYPCSENKDADQLRGYREADLRLCFRPCKLLVFSRTGSNIVECQEFVHILKFIVKVNFTLGREEKLFLTLIQPVSLKFAV